MHALNKSFVTAQVPEECPEAVELLIAQCLEKEVSRRPNARQVYDAMQAVLKGEGGLPDEPVRVVNTDPTWGSSGTDSTFDSAGSRMSYATGSMTSNATDSRMSTATAPATAPAAVPANSIAAAGVSGPVDISGARFPNGNGVRFGNGNGSGAATSGVRISRGNTALRP